MSTIQTVKTPDKYVWECDLQHCRFVASNADKATTEAEQKRHRLMHVMAKKGTSVRILADRSGYGRAGDTGRITYAYIDQDRYGVLLDRKGKCGGCRHCDGCGGPTALSTEVKFDQLEVTRDRP